MALSSKKLYFRHNNTTYSLPLFTANHTPFTIAVSDGSNTYHALTDGGGGSPYTENNIKYFYNSAKPSIHAISGGGSPCNIFNDSETVSQYDIPAGTYTPSAFRALIEQYISNNGSRTCANAFTATVNGQTITVSSGTTISYQVNSSSPQGYARAVYFGGNLGRGTGAPEYYYNSSSRGFTDGKCYVVYNAGGAFVWTTQFALYANYNITIGTGIKFN